MTSFRRSRHWLLLFLLLPLALVWGCGSGGPDGNDDDDSANDESAEQEQREHREAGRQPQPAGSRDGTASGRHAPKRAGAARARVSGRAAPARAGHHPSFPNSFAGFSTGS